MVEAALQSLGLEGVRSLFVMVHRCTLYRIFNQLNTISFFPSQTALMNRVKRFTREKAILTFFYEFQPNFLTPAAVAIIM
jgi:hypothetical protein